MPWSFGGGKGVRGVRLLCAANSPRAASFGFVFQERVQLVESRGSGAGRGALTCEATSSAGAHVVDTYLVHTYIHVNDVLSILGRFVVCFAGDDWWWRNGVMVAGVCGKPFLGWDIDTLAKGENEVGIRVV